MNVITIDWLSRWFASNKSLVADRKADVTLFVKNTATNNPVQVYDVETPIYLARISLWESGECDVDAIAKEDPERDRFYAHRIISSEAELDQFLQRFVALL